MSDTRTPGQIGYEAYGEDSGWKAFDGRPMPRWADLRPDIANRWEVAAGAIESGYLNRIHEQWKSRRSILRATWIAPGLPDGALPVYDKDPTVDQPRQIDYSPIISREDPTDE
jgi:hypothetical protein